MTGRLTYFARLTLMAAGLIGAVCCLQLLLHVGSCGNGPNALAFGFGPCPGGIIWAVLGGVAGLLIAIYCAATLGGPATSLAFGLGLSLLGLMFAILGLIPAPGDAPTLLGLAVGAPFLLGGIIGFGFTVRAYLRRPPA